MTTNNRAERREEAKLQSKEAKITRPSPIWAIDLYERRAFRNGTTGAQCQECGQLLGFELNSLRKHIAQEHPEYALKLLEKQIELVDQDGVDEEQQQEARKDPDELPIGLPQSSTSLTTANNVQEQQDLINDIKAENLSFSDQLMMQSSFSEQLMMQSSSSSSAHYSDQYGDQWLWMANIIVDGTTDGQTDLLDQICRQHGLSLIKSMPQNGLALFGCRFGSASEAKCPFRGLYVFERSALFSYDVHNHPTSVVVEEAEQQSAPEKLSAATNLSMEDDGGNESDVSVSYLDCTRLAAEYNREIAETRKMPHGSPVNDGGVVEHGSAAAENAYFDHHNKCWPLLARVEHEAELLAICRQQAVHTILTRKNLVGSIHSIMYGCTKRRAPTNCPYRAIYVPDRHAIFHRLEHNHMPISDKKKKRAKKINHRLQKDQKTLHFQWASAPK